MAGAFFIRDTLIDNISMGASITSAAQSIENQDNLGLAFKWTSSNAVGTFSVEVSNDFNANFPSLANWNALTFDPVLSAPASNNGSFWVDVNQCAASHCRVKYTRTSGTGTLLVTFSAKAV